MTEYTWIGWGRDGKCIPIPGEALATFECVHCERIITAESDPEQACPYPKGRYSDALRVGGGASPEQSIPSLPLSKLNPSNSSTIPAQTNHPTNLENP
jgi:hypothetical protein